MGAPLTLADVFLALGSGFGGAGFCEDKLNYANTDKGNPQYNPFFSPPQKKPNKKTKPEKHKKATKDNSAF